MTVKPRTKGWGRKRDPHADTGDKPWLLYVDDDARNRDIMRHRLEELYHLLIADGDRAACELWRQHSQQVGCVLLDIELRGSLLNGVEMARILTGKQPSSELPSYAEGLPISRAPVFFVTAFGDELGHESLAQAGGAAVISKPIDFERLIHLLSQHVAA